MSRLRKMRGVMVEGALAQPARTLSGSCAPAASVNARSDAAARTQSARRMRLFEESRRREVARERRLLHELFRVEGPELADLRIGLEDRVDELPVLPLDLADADIEHRRPELVEVHRAVGTV